MRTSYSIPYPSLAPGVKRLLDISISFLGLALLLPLLILIAFLVWLDSPGPVIFRQPRIGRLGHVFWILKFRTMLHAPAASLDEFLNSDPKLRLTFEQRQKLSQDPRITRLGRILRRFSLDELPQLWNVLVGEMSLVGARPFLEQQMPYYGALYREYIDFRPGMTGLWQVSGRNNLSFRERASLDSVYFAHWSLGLDLWILLRTGWVVISGRGAC